MAMVSLKYTLQLPQQKQNKNIPAAKNPQEYLVQAFTNKISIVYLLIHWGESCFCESPRILLVFSGNLQKHKAGLCPLLLFVGG